MGILIWGIKQFLWTRPHDSDAPEVFRAEECRKEINHDQKSRTGARRHFRPRLFLEASVLIQPVHLAHGATAILHFPSLIKSSATDDSFMASLRMSEKIKPFGYLRLAKTPIAVRRFDFTLLIRQLGCGFTRHPQNSLY
ncbi:MAG: hypothetical protein HYU36_11440 [Planctomycetes bacterium]|nr:hypothetical protein [Planctomycetota bacterium]